jgi:hypothetical protein
MKRTIKTLTVAGLMIAGAAPAFAAAHLNSSMTCAEYMALSQDEQTQVATMALAEIDAEVPAPVTDGEPKAVEDSVGDTTPEEATDGVAEEGSVIAGEAKAVEPTGGNTEESNMTAEAKMQASLELLNATCESNLDAMVSEAAIGMSGTN